MKLKTIIWDWNGTLLNDAFVCRTVMNQLLAKRKLPQMSAARYQSIFDFPVHIYYARLGFDFSKDSFEILGTEFINRYEKRRGECRLQRGARSLIQFIQSRHIQQAILSAYRHDTLVSLLKHKGLGTSFDWIVGADDHYARGKQEQGRKLMRMTGGSRHDTLLIGDTVHDAEVATALGIECVLVHAGHQDKKRLIKSGKPVMNNLNEVRDWLTENI